ncbi:MAG: MBL fold metallo-hydrolase [bacterium]|nr:MBL fold metallo-hydrolase [bacterium]
MSAWEKLEDNLYVFRDSCNVYAVRGPEGIVLINAGTGLAADHLSELTPNGDLVLLLTHHFRDHTDGAIRLHEAGATVLGPYWEQDYLLDPDQHFRERQIWNLYDNRWDRFSPVRPLPIQGWMMDYETRHLAGLDWEVVPTPAQTQGAVSYIVTLNGRRLAFVGETVCGHGRTGRLAPLQYNYNDLTGAVNLWKSAGRLLNARPDRILPSLGEPADDPTDAVNALRANLRKLDNIQPGLAEQFKDPDPDDIEEVLPRLYRSKHANAQTHFIIGASGNILSIDYGYNTAAYLSPQKQHLSNRRPFLHGMDGLKKHFGADRIHTVLVSHFHDDHVNGIPMLQRCFGTEVWAGELFADLLENPPRYDRPCLWHEPIHVAKKLPCGEPITWEDITFTLHPMSGHTRFSTLICMNIDGTRVAHTGDQIFFRDPDGAAYGPDAQPFTNHVYKNGLDLGCYKDTLKHLKAFRPDLVLTGHTRPYRPDNAWYDRIEEAAHAFDEVHLGLMTLGEDDVHFGPESQGGKLKPYQVRLSEARTIEFEGWIINPFPSTQKAHIELVAPDGWKSDPVEYNLGPREQADIRITLTPPKGTHCRRQPIGLSLTVGEQPFGQVAETLVTVGHPLF